MWPRGDGPEEDEADSTNTAGLWRRELGAGGLVAPTFTDVMVPDEEENPLVLPRACHVKKPHSMVNTVCWPVI